MSGGGDITMKVRTFWHSLANYALQKMQSEKNFAAGWNENVWLHETPNSLLFAINSHHCNFFFGSQLKNLHFVLAKCLKWRRNHDPYSTKTTSNIICSKWKRGKMRIFKDEMEKNMMKTFNPAGLLQAPPPCLYVHVCFKRMNPHTYHILSSYMGLA